jgi:hypothetical protein
MKRFFTLLLIVLICIGCKKNNPSSETIKEPQDYTVRVKEDESKTLQETVKIQAPKTVQEIIDNYAASKLLLLASQIEGNFTGSGNREIIGFYESIKPAREGDICEVFCFVLAPNGESIDNIYAIDYLTWEFNDNRISKSEMVLSEDLGKPIVWRDRVIGSFGDFNKNGRDELYLFSVNLYMDTYFYEFDGNEFKKIIDFGSGGQITISGIDSEKKIIFLKKIGYIESLDYQRIEAIHTYIWDETTQMYEFLSRSELKYFKWNRSLQQYEEIEQ